MTGAADSGDNQSARERLLQTAGELFYAHGISAVGVDMIIERAGVAKMTLYRNFRSKSQLVCAWLERRHAVWLSLFEQEILSSDAPARQKILAVFDLLGQWFDFESFNGCAYINADAHNVDAEAQAVIRQHKHAMREIFAKLAAEAGLGSPEEKAEQLFLLMEGCTVAARVHRSSRPAKAARAAAERIVT